MEKEYIYILKDKWIIFEHDDHWHIHSLSYSPHIFNHPIVKQDVGDSSIMCWKGLYSKHTLLDFRLDLNTNTGNVDVFFSDGNHLHLDEHVPLLIYEQHPFYNDTTLPMNTWIITHKGPCHAIPAKYKWTEDGMIIASLHPFFHHRTLPPDNDDGLVIIEPKYCYTLTQINSRRALYDPSHSLFQKNQSNIVKRIKTLSMYFFFYILFFLLIQRHLFSIID